nr:MAG TPA: hypothetical protein [Caudoviricetes sp.]
MKKVEGFFVFLYFFVDNLLIVNLVLIKKILVTSLVTRISFILVIFLSYTI